MLRISGKAALFLSVCLVVVIVSIEARAAAAPDNTKLGKRALASKPTGSENTAIGFHALEFDTTGNQNTAVGAKALQSNTSGDGNTATGVQALAGNTVGDNNTATGARVLEMNTEGNDNTAAGFTALISNTTGDANTATGLNALQGNTTGSNNTATGANALISNDTGSNNTAIGRFADVSTGNLTNATAIGNGATVNASNKVRLGNNAVTVIEGQVAFTASSDATSKENFLSVNGEEVLKKVRGLTLTSWNFIGHDPKEFRHYGPMAQEFFAAFGRDGIGMIGTPTTINSGDMAGILMIAVQALEKRTAEVTELRARLEALERWVKDRPGFTASVQPLGMAE